MLSTHLTQIKCLFHHKRSFKTFSYHNQIRCELKNYNDLNWMCLIQDYKSKSILMSIQSNSTIYWYLPSIISIFNYFIVILFQVIRFYLKFQFSLIFLYSTEFSRFEFFRDKNWQATRHLAVISQIIRKCHLKVSKVASIFELEDNYMLSILQINLIIKSDILIVLLFNLIDEFYNFILFVLFVYLIELFRNSH